ncbi:hypothetical protein [Amycolatopsis sp. cg9]|uniref:hypothetical protein n=1 Tax=Amycolatopsis sp. cg9 TaxID=3238801 RepID=UPI00352402AC
MDFLFTLLLTAWYPAIGLHTARTVLREATTPGACAWLCAAAMVPLWPAVELLPPLAAWCQACAARLARTIRRTR